jgi:hypothetical protein
VAAEIGVHLGVALVVMAAAMGAISGWPSWSDRTRVAVMVAAGLGPLASAAWLRDAGGPELAEQRRRATSTLLTAGILVLAGGAWGAVRAGTERFGWGLPAIALGGLLATWGADRVANSPVSQAALLAWAAALVVGLTESAGTWCLPALVVLGTAWSVLGWRYLSARRTAAAAGVVLALGAAVIAANGYWAWPARLLLLATGVGSAWRFLAGGRNAWLGLGVAAWAALAASAAGAILGPLLALAIGGAVTVAVSLVALRNSVRE